MAGGMDLGSGSGRGKRPLDASVNLVPFIDLMAVTIVFLIMTAVWTQAARLRANTPGHSTGEPGPSPPALVVALSAQQLTVSVEGTTLQTVAVTRDVKGRLETRAIATAMADWKLEHQDAFEVRLKPDEEVPFEDLVRLMDASVGAGLPEVSLW
jgi:biopolymer transport protein TolR